MLERIVQGLQTVEKYTVRVMDEGIHKIINSGVEYIEDNYRIPRKFQAKLLSSSSALYTLTAGMAWPAIKALHKSSRDFVSLTYFYLTGSIQGYVQKSLGTDFELVKSIGTYFPAYIIARADLLILDRESQTKQYNGTLTNPEVHSYNSLSGLVRPYLLAGSIVAVYFGIVNETGTMFNYGASGLPLAISFYVRDSDSGGLLHKIGEKIKQLLSPALVPLPQKV